MSFWLLYTKLTVTHTTCTSNKNKCVPSETVFKFGKKRATDILSWVIGIFICPDRRKRSAGSCSCVLYFALRVAWHHTGFISQQISFSRSPPLSAPKKCGIWFLSFPLCSSVWHWPWLCYIRGPVSLRHLPSQTGPQPRLSLYVVSPVSVGLDCVITFGRSFFSWLSAFAILIFNPRIFPSFLSSKYSNETKSEPWKLELLCQKKSDKVKYSVFYSLCRSLSFSCHAWAFQLDSACCCLHWVLVVKDLCHMVLGVGRLLLKYPPCFIFISCGCFIEVLQFFCLTFTMWGCPCCV